MKDSKQLLDLLLEAYGNAPEIYQAGRYWKAYEDKIASDIRKANLSELRSGKYPIFGTFGFSEAVYHYPTHVAGWKTGLLKLLRSQNVGNKIWMPYNMNLRDVQEMAYRHCELMGELSGAKPIQEIETSTYGNPSDLFEVNGRKYTMQFLNFYLRYCFVQKELQLKGDEVIVELGTGSGFQIEILKKIHPELTILCFDLPAPLYLGEHYLSKVFPDMTVSASENLDIQSLDTLPKGKISFFGNWQIPLLKDLSYDIFWNAASFGEMEPHIVENYLSFVKSKAARIYLLQARHGKESGSTSGVEKKIRLEDYQTMLNGYRLIKEDEVYQANRKLSQSGGYFQGIWEKEE